MASEPCDVCEEHPANCRCGNPDFAREQKAIIDRLRIGLGAIMSCAGAPDPVGALHTVIELARRALNGEAVRGVGKGNRAATLKPLALALRLRKDAQQHDGGPHILAGADYELVVIDENGADLGTLNNSSKDVTVRIGTSLDSVTVLAEFFVSEFGGVKTYLGRNQAQSQ